MRHRDGKTDGRTHEIDGRMNRTGQKDRRTDGWMNGRDGTDGRMDGTGQTYSRTDGWTKRQTRKTFRVKCTCIRKRQ